MKKINLIYWNKDNFGDQLSPYIVSKLSGETIRYKRGTASLRYSFKEILSYVLRLKFAKISEMLFNWQDSLLAVGSIINLGNSKSKIWGSGFMNENQPFYGGKVCAVRGKFTAQKIAERGYETTDVYGDPALLLPLIFTPPILGDRQIAIIPHITEFKYFKEKYGAKYDVIDFRTRNIEKTISEICRYRLILSSSLHGLIVAHAYGIPALWIKHGYIHTDGIKFKDYFSSVGISCYDGFENIDELMSKNPKEIETFFIDNEEIANPQVSLSALQKKLIEVAPFPIQPVFNIK